MQDWKKYLKFVVITAGFAILLLIAFFKVFNMSMISDADFKTYKQGLSYLQAKDYQNAYFNFANVSKTSALYEIALLRQALCADELQDSETAVKKYHTFIEHYPDSIFIQKVYYSLGQNYFKEKDYKKAEKTFAAIRKNFPDNEYKTASNYYLGEITKEKNPERAKVFFIEYLKDAPQGRFAVDCAKGLMSLNKIANEKDKDKDKDKEKKEPAEREVLFTPYDNSIVGKTLFYNREYSGALEFFQRADIKKVWNYIYLINLYKYDTAKAWKAFENGYSLYSNSIETEELYTALEKFAQNYPNGEKSGWYKLLELSRKYHSKGEDYILYRLAKLEEDSVKSILYKDIYMKYPKGDYASDAVSNLFWINYKKGDYSSAYRIGMVHLRDYPNTTASPRVMFWMGKLADKTGRKNEARGFYQRVLDLYPDDYYAYRADKKLSFYHGNDWQTKSSHRLPEHDINIRFPVNHTKLSDDNISLVNIILKTGDYELLSEVEKDNKFVQSWLNYKEGKFATSAILARDALKEEENKPEFTDSVYQLAYQLHFQDLINDYTNKYDLDAFLIAALIREESYFNVQAGSTAGARGLMQLMPSTASYIASKSGIPFSSSKLYDPETNIELGCAYFRHIQKLLNDNDMLAVASYNGGPNAVRSWKNSLDYNNFDEFVESIPYSETRDYVKKVFRTYWIYTNMY